LPGLAGEKGVISGILKPTHGADDTFIYCRLEDAQNVVSTPAELTAYPGSH